MKHNHALGSLAKPLNHQWYRRKRQTSTATRAKPGELRYCLETLLREDLEAKLAKVAGRIFYAKELVSSLLHFRSIYA